MRGALLLAGSAMVMGAFLTTSELEAQISFPHQTHSVFFSDCTACHGGVTTGEWASVYPETATCAACHDGTTAPSIDWTPPETPRESNLAFRHQAHGFACTMCHVPGGGEDLSLIAIPEPATCLGCHAPQAPSHLEAREQCQTCHVPAAESRLSAQRMAEFPKPESHRFGNWVDGHRSVAASTPEYCTICHTEGSCASCHEGQSSPAFHPLNFLASHGPEAFGRVSDCSSCHNTEAFCRTCHLGLGLDAAGNIGGAYHNDQALWILGHAPAARQDLESCVSCHQQTDCLRCHSAQSGLGVSPHGPDFDGSSISDRNKAMCTLCHISGG
jgi:predicted CXXCH cytochrome family protein